MTSQLPSLAGHADVPTLVFLGRDNYSSIRSFIVFVFVIVIISCALKEGLSSVLCAFVRPPMTLMFSSLPRFLESFPGDPTLELRYRLGCQVVERVWLNVF